MCGRYNVVNWTQVTDWMRADFGVEIPTMAPRYNVSPSQTMPIVALDADGRPRAALMRWGLVPFWEKSAKPKIAPINARAEEAMGKPMFRQGIQRRRCLIPATGFFEWQKLPGDLKQPFAIGLKGGGPFCFAGIYESATELHPETYLLFTTKPNSLMAPIHDRMPAILDQATARDWIQAGEISADRFATLTAAYPAEKMAAVPVSTLVNSPKNDRPEIMLTVS